MSASAPTSAPVPRIVLALTLAVAAAALLSPASAQAPDRFQRWDPDWEPPRTAWGDPDVQGNWTNATLTPFQRPPGSGRAFTRAQADSVEAREEARVRRGLQPSDPDRPPPEPGNVGAYNEVYFERGDRVAVVDGEPRTSLITVPADGRIPELTPEGLRRKRQREEFRSRFGAYDHPELRPIAERCVVYYASSPTGVMGPPMTPTRGYNNNLTVVQTPDRVLIRSEMIHDVRVIRLGEPDPLPDHVRPWFGDSWGHWEGDTLVVETTNIHPDQGIEGADGWIVHSEALKVIERFARVDEDTILYEFEVRDPRTYSRPWGGEIPWERFDRRIYEYACHEGNYALYNVLSGARYQERTEAEGRAADEARDPG